MIACDPLVNAIVMNAITGGANHWSYRRDVIANIGTASDYAPQIFIEDRTASSLGDQSWITHKDDGGTWIWERLTATGSSGGGVF